MIFNIILGTLGSLWAHTTNINRGLWFFSSRFTHFVVLFSLFRPQISSLYFCFPKNGSNGFHTECARLSYLYIYLGMLLNIIFFSFYSFCSFLSFCQKVSSFDSVYLPHSFMLRGYGQFCLFKIKEWQTSQFRRLYFIV